MKILAENNQNQRLIGTGINLNIWRQVTNNNQEGNLLLPPDHELFELEIHTNTDTNDIPPKRRYFVQILNVRFFLRYITGSHYRVNTLTPIDIQTLNASTVSLEYTRVTDMWVRWFTPYGSHYLVFDAGTRLRHSMPFNLNAQCFWMSKRAELLAMAQGIHGRTAQNSSLRVLSSDVLRRIADFF